MFFDQNGNLLVSAAPNSGSIIDISDRAGRIVGHVVVDSGSITVTSAIPTGFNLIGSVNIADSSNSFKAQVDAALCLLVSTGGATKTAIAAGAAANTVVKASAARLARVLVTAVGTNAMLIYDNATTGSGTIIGVIPANAAVGSVYDFSMPAANGITVAGNAANPGVTISYS